MRSCISDWSSELFYCDECLTAMSVCCCLSSLWRGCCEATEVCHRMFQQVLLISMLWLIRSSGRLSKEWSTTLARRLVSWWKSVNSQLILKCYVIWRQIIKYGRSRNCVYLDVAEMYVLVFQEPHPKRLTVGEITAKMSKMDRPLPVFHYVKKLQQHCVDMVGHLCYIDLNLSYVIARKWKITKWASMCQYSYS